MTTYGCRDPRASNHDETAMVDDGSCVYNVPEGCKRPTWGYDAPMHQLIVIIQRPTFDGEPLTDDDAIGAFHEGESVGFGFVEGGFLTLSAMNVAHEGLVTFSLYDTSSESISPLELIISAPELDEGYKTRFFFVGCTDESAENYLPEATISSEVCLY